jgi:hypothetical protein
MNQLISVLADGKLRYYLTDGDELVEFALVNVGAIGHANGQAAVAIATVGAAMVDGFGLDHRRATVTPRALPPGPDDGTTVTMMAWEEVVAYITAHPGQSTTGVRRGLGWPSAAIQTALRRAGRNHGLIRQDSAGRWHPDSPGSTPRPKRRPVDSEATDRVLAAITAQPGAATAELRAAADVTAQQWTHCVATLRQRGISLRCEGWSTTARWYVDE